MGQNVKILVPVQIMMETKLWSSNAFPENLVWWMCHCSDDNHNFDNLDHDSDDYEHDGDNADDNGHGHDVDWTTRAVAQDELNAADSEKITGIGILTFIRWKLFRQSVMRVILMLLMKLAIFKQRCHIS